MGLMRAGTAPSSVQDAKLWAQKPESTGGRFAPLQHDSSAERHAPLQLFGQKMFAGFQFWEPESEGEFWDQYGMAVYVGIGALALVVVLGLIYVVRKPAPTKEGKETSAQGSAGQVLLPAPAPQHEKDPETPAPSDADSKAGTGLPAKEDIAAIVSLAQRVTKLVGPKLAKSQALKNVISKRVSGVRGRAEQMLMQEVNGMAAEVCEVIDAPEMMLLQDWSGATAGFPPLPGLVSGLIAPLRLQSSLSSNILHIIGILPIIALCGWAFYEDYRLSCNPIPSLRWWIISTLCIGGLLTLARTMLVLKTRKGLKTLQDKANEMHMRSELRLAEYGAHSDGGLREIKELLIDHSTLASHALKVDASINASRWNPIVGICTVLWVCCILWNLYEAFLWSFVPGRVAFHEAAKTDPNFCASWHVVLVGRIVAVLSVVLLLFNLFAIFLWVLGSMMQSDSVAAKIHEATRKFDRNTTGLPVSQLFVRLCIMPTTELDQIHLHQVRQKYITAEEDLRRTEKNLESLKQRRDKQAAKLEKLEAKAAENAKIGKHKDPMDQTLEEIEQAIRNSFDPDSWRTQGLDTIRQVKESSPKEEDGSTPQSDSLERIISDVTDLAARFQKSEGFQKASEAAQSAAAYSSEKAQEAYAQAQQIDTTALLQSSKEALGQATEQGQAQQSEAFQKAQSAATSAMEQAPGALQKAQDAAKQAQGAASTAMAKKGDSKKP